MSKLIPLFKKFALAALALAILLTVLPATSASAAGLQDPTNPPAQLPFNDARLERAWARTQAAYDRQGYRLDQAEAFIARIQNLIDKASQNGKDTSAVQAALDALAAVIPAVQTAHAPGATIIGSHAGFDANGIVTERSTAIETVKSLAQVLKDTRTAMNGTGHALRDAIKAFRMANKPTP